MININPMSETKSGILLSFNSMDVPVAMIKRKPKTAKGKDSFDNFDLILFMGIPWLLFLLMFVM
jgi:hypothetical protein